MPSAKSTLCLLIPVLASFASALHPTVYGCPYDECISRCVVQYGGDGTSGNSYHCSKGCAGIKRMFTWTRSSNGSVQIVEPTKFCSVAEAERYDFCLGSCESIISNESDRKYCEYGCEFWQAETDVISLTAGVASITTPLPTPSPTPLPTPTPTPSTTLATTEMPSYGPTASFPSYVPTTKEEGEEANSLSQSLNTMEVVTTESPIVSPTMTPSYYPSTRYPSFFPTAEENGEQV